MADKSGFHATITTNEIGTESKNPADVTIDSSAPEVVYPEGPSSASGSRSNAVSSGSRGASVSTGSNVVKTSVDAVDDSSDENDDFGSGNSIVSGKAIQSKSFSVHFNVFYPEQPHQPRPAPHRKPLVQPPEDRPNSKRTANQRKPSQRQLQRLSQSPDRSQGDHSFGNRFFNRFLRKAWT